MEKNKIDFQNEELSNQRLKNIFVCILCSWTKVFIDDSFLPLVNFIDCWVCGCCFLVASLFSWINLLVTGVYFLYTLGRTFGTSFL